MKYKILYLIVFTFLVSPFSLQVTAAELCGGSELSSLEKPLMEKEPKGEEEEEEEEPDCDE